MNIAIPSAKIDLGITDTNQQWIITAYTLAFGSLLLLGGRIGDYMGRKKIFLIGLIGFAAASALGGIASNQELLFASRALQGVFAALLAPAALAIISVTFTVPAERAKAFGVIGAISGGGAAIGLILGGALTEYFSWRWCLGVNTPIAIGAAILAIKFVRESKAQGDNTYDIPGVITATAGLFALTYGFHEAATKGWSSSLTIGFLVSAVFLLAIFVAIEKRVANPLMPLRVVTDRNRGGSYLGSLVVGAGLFSMFLFLGLYLQVILGFSPLKSGFAFLPFTFGIIIFAGIASQLLPKVGPKPLMVPGLIFAAIGMLLLSRITPETSYLTHVVPSLLIMSSGMALVFIPLTSTSLHAVSNHDTGVAKGELTDKLARQVVEGVVAGEGTPSEVVAKRGIKVVNDDGALMAAIEKVCAEQAETAEKVRGGHLPAAGALIGAVMKETKGQADAARVRELLLGHLGVN